MSDFNRVILVGRLGNQPELKESSTGKSYLRINIATNSFRKDGNTTKKSTHWHRVVVFGAQAKLCATYLKKGSPVLVEGSIEVRTYTDKEGKMVNQNSILADRVRFLGGRLHATLSEPDQAADQFVDEASSPAA